MPEPGDEARMLDFRDYVLVSEGSYMMRFYIKVALRPLLVT